MFRYAAMAIAMMSTALVASCSPEGEELPSDQELVITADKFLLVADSADQVFLTVTLGDADITTKANIYINDVKKNCTVFSTAEAGTYHVYASYAGQISNTITLKAAGDNLFPDFLADPQETAFSNFRRRILLVEGTGTWCQYCPYVIKAIEIFEEEDYSQKDNAVIVAAHSGDAIASTASEKVISHCSITSYPSCVYNFDKSTYHSYVGYASTTAQYINNAVATEMSEPASVGICASAAEDGVTMAVRAKVKIGQSGQYRINAFLVESGLMHYQTGANVSTGFDSSTIAHNHVLRAAACESPISGSLLGSREGEWQAGETAEYYAAFELEDYDIKSVENCAIVVLVTKANAYNKYYVNNVITCAPNGKVAFEYNK